jgi:hypothetical protein
MSGNPIQKNVGYFAVDFKKKAAGTWTGPRLNEMDSAVLTAALIF